MENSLISTTMLLYSDKRVDLKKAAFNKVEEIFKINKIPYTKEDVKYYENIKIDDCREVVEDSSKSSYKGIKAFILNFDEIRNEASNALLKIIEEPPRNTYFILLSTNINKILKTILSRCVKIYIKPNDLSVSDKIYNIFDGNMEYINEFIEENINLDDYKIESMEDAYYAIEKYNNEENLNKYIYMQYKLALIYLIYEGKFQENDLKLLYIQKIIDIYDGDRQKSIDLLNKILILIAFKVNKATYKILVDLKNSIRNNVNLKAVLYMFLCIVLEEV